MDSGTPSPLRRRLNTALVFLAPAVPLAIVALVLMGSARGWATERATDHAERMGQVVSNAAVAPHIEQSDLSGNGISAQRAKELDAAIRPVLNKTILRVRVWSVDGQVIYADEPDLVNARYPISDDLQSALDGYPAAVESFLEREENHAEQIEADRLLEVYVPLPGDKQGAGAVEFYLPMTPIDAEVAQDLRRILIALMIGLVLLYALFAKFALDLLKARRHAQRKEHEAEHDPLTGLPNRRYFDRVLSTLVENEPHRNLTVMVIDLDDFKRVNDMVGHAGGDELLSALARRLRGAVREEGTVARIGGDEFAVLLPDTVEREEIDAIARRLVQDLNAPVRLSGTRIYAGASLGSASGRGLTHDADELVGNADAALYIAKSEEKGRHVAFRTGMRSDINSRPALDTEMRHAHEHKEFQVVYQPAVDHAGNIRAMEALLRWEHPDLGVLDADEFLPALRRHGLFDEVAADALEDACREASSWEGDPAPSLTVNLSRSQLLDGELIETVVHALRASGLEPERLNLELAKGVDVDSPAARDALRRLAGLGVNIWIDSWGTNGGALDQLREIAFDGLKVDCDLVCDLTDNPRAGALISAAVHMTRNLEMGSAASAVETKEQRERLITLGVELMQGRLFSGPVDADAAACMVRQGRLPVRAPQA